jgi:TatA/E family protein of Tat protein translocase
MRPCLAILGLGGGELAVIGLIALLLFGARLPKIARSLGQSVGEFKEGMRDAPDPHPPSDDAAGTGVAVAPPTRSQRSLPG